MATHSSTLAWKSHGQRSLVGCSQWGRQESDMTERLHFHFSLSLFTFMHWRRKWQPTPVFLPGESQGWGSLVGCRLWDCIESDTTEATQQQQEQQQGQFSGSQGSQSQRSHSKASGLDLWSGMKFPQVVCYGIK